MGDRLTIARRSSPSTNDVFMSRSATCWPPSTAHEARLATFAGPYGSALVEVGRAAASAALGVAGAAAGAAVVAASSVAVVMVSEGVASATSGGARRPQAARIAAAVMPKVKTRDRTVPPVIAAETPEVQKPTFADELRSLLDARSPRALFQSLDRSTLHPASYPQPFGVAGPLPQVVYSPGNPAAGCPPPRARRKGGTSQSDASRSGASQSDASRSLAPRGALRCL